MLPAQPLPEILEETAKDLLSKYICVFDTYSNFQRANDLYFDSIAMIKDGFLEEMSEGEYLALYEENKYYQECIAAGEAELVLFGIPNWTALPCFRVLFTPLIIQSRWIKLSVLRFVQTLFPAMQAWFRKTTHPSAGT